MLTVAVQQGGAEGDQSLAVQTGEEETVTPRSLWKDVPRKRK